MWKSRNKTDLIIEVYEKLDCDSVGAAELEAIETVIRDQFGSGAVDSPMIVARLLADEGAELRHSEIMALYLERASDRPYDAALRNVIDATDLDTARKSLRRAENLRRKFHSENDKEGLRLLTAVTIAAKTLAAETAARKNVTPDERAKNAEIAQWLTIWLQTPEMFESWLGLRKRSAEFLSTFENEGYRM